MAKVDTKPFSMRKPRDTLVKRGPNQTVEVVESMQPVIPALNRAPLRPGALVMTQQEKMDLAALGYKDGDNIPPGMAKEIHKVRQEAAAALQRDFYDMAKTGKVLKLPNEIPIANLPAEKQAELRAYMAQADDEAEKFKSAAAQAAMMAQLPDSLRKAAEMAAEPVQAFRGAPRAEQPAPQPTAVPDVSETTAPSEEPVGDGGGTIEHCPHCNYYLKNPAKAEPTRDDYFGFAEAILAGKRFHKEFTFFGGRLRVVYRSLSEKMSTLSLSQIAIDQREGRFSDSREKFWTKLWDYRTIASLAEVTFDGERFGVAEQVDAAVLDPQEEELINPDGLAQNSGVFRKETVLPFLVKSLTDQECFNDESIWRIIVMNAKRFSDLVEVLEARADDPSFWPAIVG